ncbi:antibiotic biosynthesis monooxygenase [Streptomyces sp. NBC_01571]|uniref:antibiotic biosynthesis monooxygenase family protein n=1 Tax=unclassified Streptomyces TaxID=2593676 RepID=UPI002250C92A|nr:antibiotic biosynthesis monooxygenase [Streptomyces sp. NBC_01571]MCX4576103.1 antibiotic biosynthesis monooxygenase [Streptomyces sp. NBC_01571]
MSDQPRTPVDVQGHVAGDVPTVLPDASVAPVAAPEPPYHAVVFTSVRTEGDHGYAETAERMGELVREIPGFLGEDSARTPGGLGITVAYFRDPAAIEQWRTDLEHLAAQRHGREHWYETYSLHVAKVERSHTFLRGGGSGRAHG